MSDEKTTEEVQEFWTNYPMLFGNQDRDADLETIFEEMEENLRQRVWYLHEEDGPLLGEEIDFTKLEGKKVLEVGYGVGWLLNEFAKHGADVYGIDLSESHYEMSRRRFQDDDNVDVQVANGEDIPFDDEEFDFVASWGVIHHAADDQAVVDEIHRVLKPGGRAYVMVYRKHGAEYYKKLFKHGIFRGKLLDYDLDVQEFMESMTDNWSEDSSGAPISRFYTRSDIERLFSDFSEVNVDIGGTRGHLSNIPATRFSVSDWLLTEDLRERLLRRFGGFWLLHLEK